MHNFRWVLVAPLVTQVIISVGKWGTYPFHSVREWYPNLGVYLIVRVVPYTLILYGLWRGLRLTERRWPVHLGSGPGAVTLAVAVFVGTLTAELGLSVVEWYVYPWYLTQQWYRGSFYLFAGNWILPWAGVYWGVSALVFLVARLTVSEH